jgi:Protein of unknown function (DUF3667)
MTNCKNCGHPVKSNYCAHCGQATALQRIDKQYVSREIQELLDFEKGVFYTAKELLIRPGKSIRTFLHENRNKHVKPLTFLVLTSLIYSLCAHLFHADGINDENAKILAESSTGAIQNWVQTNYGYTNILMGFFIALCLRLLFRKHPYNFFEIIIMLCFVMGQGMLLLTVETFFAPFLSKITFINILTLISLIYPTWAIGQFFGSKKVSSYVKAFFAYLLGFFLFYLVIFIVGTTADLILNMNS